MLTTSLFPALYKGKKAKFSATGVRPPKELRPLLKELLVIIEQGELSTLVDKTFKLSEVQAAHEYVDTGRKIGNVVITPDTV